MDQQLWDNPLSMRQDGYGPETARGATTGAAEIVLDGMRIGSPEAVAAHIEAHLLPQRQAELAAFDAEAWAGWVAEGERAAQERLGQDILKAPYGWAGFPVFRYGLYGYEHYFSAWALYPEVIEREMSLTADLCALRNAATARAIVENGLPPYIRLDFDLADSRGTLASPESLDRIWLPHFARAVAPLARSPVRMVWHCDGNLMALAPRLLEAGVKGFQGFQYEDGMDYEAICRMKARDGDDLLIIGGVSVTRTLPFGRPADVARELSWLVRHGPRNRLFLGVSSSVAPGAPWENLQALAQGLRHYREGGR
ncbi:MAG: hypothetical protein FWF90_09645 [Promicromonosporaceae bacterium]|nr:hypothetical protein [Promicromonosporaceae bacterium]